MVLALHDVPGSDIPMPPMRETMLAAVQAAMLHFNETMKIVDDLKLCLVRNRTNLPFVTSDNTELLYVDPGRAHELPELCNGLGFKNLIYMAIQARHFHSKWVLAAENRSLCGAGRLQPYPRVAF